MAWTCLVLCACGLCWPLGRCHVLHFGGCIFKVNGSCISVKRHITVDYWDTLNHLCNSWIARDVSLTQWLSVHQRRVSKVHITEFYLPCSRFFVPPSIEWTNLESSSVFQDLNEKEDFRAYWNSDWSSRTVAQNNIFRSNFIQLLIYGICMYFISYVLSSV